MLDHITIKHFTIIENVELDFHQQMTVITGETGSGKSIIIDAIEFALGERASTQCIYKEADKCEVTLTFSDIGPAEDWLKAHAFDANEACIIRRVLYRDGRSRHTINDNPCTAKLLREFSGLLISIHGQHAHQELLKSHAQRALLDQYAGHITLVEKTQAFFDAWKKTNAELLALKEREQVGGALEFIQYQLDELHDLQLQADEITHLYTEHKQLHHADELQKKVHDSLALLSSGENAPLTSQLANCICALQAAQTIAPVFSNCLSLLKSAAINIEEASHELHHVSFNSDPLRLADVEKRLELIEKISRKHRVKPSGLLDTYEKLLAEKALLENSKDHILSLENEMMRIEKDYHCAALALSKSRQKTALMLSKDITEKLQRLGMEGGEFFISLEKQEGINAHGIDAIHFLIKTNAGQPFLPLQKIVSGGELSRISLAIQVITAQKSSIPALVFDEVDVGIGGKTAEIVGQLLQQLGERNQVLCITHLPQVAALGKHHITVTKTQHKTHTTIHIQTLNKVERIAEIARMLGGITISEQTVAHARELLA